MCRRKNTLGTSAALVLIALGVFLVFAGCTPKRVRNYQEPRFQTLSAQIPGFDLRGARRLDAAPFRDARAMWLLRDGTLVLQADLDIDVDGSPRARELDRENGKLMTSLRYPGLAGQRQYVNSEKVPYIVLPTGLAERHGLELGDLGAVLYKGKVAFGIYADNGPVNKAGEVSMKLAEDLGHAPWHQWPKGTSLSKRGGIKQQDFLYLVFPRSRPDTLHPDSIVRKIQELGAKEWRFRSRRPGI
jgi:hypothetical protein